MTVDTVKPACIDTWHSRLLRGEDARRSFAEVVDKPVKALRTKIISVDKSEPYGAVNLAITFIVDRKNVDWKDVCEYCTRENISVHALRTRLNRLHDLGMLLIEYDGFFWKQLRVIGDMWTTIRRPTVGREAKVTIDRAMGVLKTLAIGEPLPKGFPHRTRKMLKEWGCVEIRKEGKSIRAFLVSKERRDHNG